LKKDLFGNEMKEFHYSTTITNSPVVAIMDVPKK